MDSLADPFTRLLHIYSAVALWEVVAQDKRHSGEPDPIRLTPAVRSKLRAQLQRLEAHPAGIKEDDTRSIDAVRAVAFPEEDQLLKGSEFIDSVVRGGAWFPWWSCEGRRKDHHNPDPVTPCDEGTRDELRTCSRVSPAFFVMLIIRLD